LDFTSVVTRLYGNQGQDSHAIGKHGATWRVISGRFIDSKLHMSPCRDVLRRALPLMLMTATSSSSLKPVYEQEEQARNNNGEEQGQ
jgi:hypothetical protein